MKKEVIVGLISIIVLLIFVLRTHISDRNSTFEPKTYYLTDFPEETTESIEPEEVNSNTRKEETTPPIQQDITEPKLAQNSKKAETKESKDVTSEKLVSNEKPAKKVQTHAPLFKIQLFVSYQKLPAQSKQFKGLSPVNYYKVKNIYKYTYGTDTDYNKIKQLKSSTVDGLFKDAFIVAFKDGEKINLEEAIKASEAE